jgi:hypothetical protein
LRAETDHPHTPPVHVCPDWQRTSHPPQLFGSVDVFGHPFPQRVVGAAHVTAHAPATQRSPAGHSWPHPPQFSGSLFVFAQTPLHDWTDEVPPSVGAPQLPTHAPATHALPAGHD